MKNLKRGFYPSENNGALFSQERIYRYALWRLWNKNRPHLMVIGLNPSTANEKQDDPTIRRCRNLAKELGYGGIVMVNLFAFRATNPRAMKIEPDPIGLRNNYWLQYFAQYYNNAGLILAAWGNHGSHMGRDREVVKLIDRPMVCLGKTKSGQPKHPLRLRRDTKLEPFQ